MKTSQIYLIKWIIRFILTCGLGNDLVLAEVSADLPMNIPFPSVNFYSLPSANAKSDVNLEDEKDFYWYTNMTHSIEYSNLNFSVPEDPQDCQKGKFLTCDPSDPYRTMNGSCNNLEHPNWGMSRECYLRFQPVFYEGFEGYRNSKSGKPLPSPRDITLNIFKDVNSPSPNVSFMFSIYGQTVAHDLSQVLVLSTPVPCCTPEFANHPSCIDIPIKSSDPFYSQFNRTCLILHAAQPCIVCNTTKKQQANAVTAALDASVIYGANDSISNEIRAKDGTGRLLPTDQASYVYFCSHKATSTCFLAGDARVNQHAILSVMTAYYVKEHNRIATNLKIINPHWEEEKLFQEARRIMAATLQCITYKEYLPQLLGPYIMDQFNLSVKNGSGASKYNPYIRLGTCNEFATAAFRLHSMISKSFSTTNFQLRNLFLNPEIVRTDYMEKIMYGICKTPSQKYDRYFVEDVTNYLAKRSSNPYGTDLSSIDIQRGRDHGVAPYTVMVRFCSEGLINISTFDDLAPLLMTHENAELLKENYESVEDIDLWVGMQMENQFPESQLGPTAVCIIAKQFFTAKFGDRFFFEHGGEVPSFTAAQRNAFKQCSLSSILCHHSNITYVQKNVMLLPSKSNPVISCKEIPDIDLSHWAESQQQEENNQIST